MASVVKETLYRVAFVNRGEIYELYAREVFQSDLFGFVEIGDFVFGTRGQVVVDPSEEKLKAEFEAVSRSYIPNGSIIRIDEVEQVGIAKISPAQGQFGNVTQFPGVPPKNSR